MLRNEIIGQAINLSKHINFKTNKNSQLSLLQLRTLVFVKEKKCVKPTELAKEFNVTPATITAQIDKLVRNGWLTRCGNTDDRRVVNIMLTSKARKELNSMVRNALKKYDWIFKILSEDEQHQLYALLVKIHQGVPLSKGGNLKNE